MNLYIFSTVLAGFLWGIISVFLKNLVNSGFASMQVLAVRSVLSAVFMLIFLFFKNRRLLKIELRDLWMFVGTGVISLTFFSVCYFYTIIESGAGVAVILLYTSPVFVLLLSALLFREKITKFKIIALVLTFTGCIFVSGAGGENHLSLRGFLIGLCAGLGYALYSIFSRFALKKYDSLTVTFYTFLFSSLSAVPLSNLAGITPLLNSTTVLLSCGIALVCTVLPYIFYTFGLTGLENSKAAIFVTVEPLVGTLAGIFLWHENITAFKALGILLIFIALLFNQKDSKNTD